MGSKSVRRSRGGRNIWRAGDPFVVGDLVDAMDKDKCWFESIIVEVWISGDVKVHFMGWGSKWDGNLLNILMFDKITKRC
jgi:hypothetical protein